MRNLIILLSLFLSFTASAQLEVYPQRGPVQAGVLKSQLERGSPTSTGQILKVILTKPGGGLTDGRFSFSLDSASVTSVGVFGSDGTLIRTIWSNVQKPAGLVTGQWDGTGDDGQPVPTDTYTIKYVANRLTYTWEGVLGNSSFVFGGGNSIHRNYQFIRGMVQVGSYNYIVQHYSETPPSISKFPVATPQIKMDFLGRGTGQASEHVAYDGTRLFIGGYDLFANYAHTTYVYAITPANDQQYTFSAGTGNYKPVHLDYSNNTLGFRKDTMSFITGMAVQKGTGNYLYVAYGLKDSLKVFDKVTGAYTRRLGGLTAPGEMTIDGNGNLWVINGPSNARVVTKHTINSDGTISGALLTLPSLVEPLALGVSQDSSIICVIDAGANQQVKAFTVSDGVLQWTLGQQGGYASTPTVSNDRFYFTDASRGITKSFICFQADGSFWVGDRGNYRAQHFSSSRTYVDNIAYTQNSYVSAVDINNPQRVFCQYLEYQIDYSKPLAAGNGSWTLVRNWRNQVPAQFFRLDNLVQNVDMFGVLSTLTTFPQNGRTYAFLLRPSDQRQVLVELPPTGQLRVTSTSFPAPVQLAADGSLNYTVNDTTAKVMRWMRRPVSSFDGSNNPVWGTAIEDASAPYDAQKYPTDASGYGNNWAQQRTSSNLALSFQQGMTRMFYGKAYGYGPHLGAVAVGGTKWKWLTAYPTALKYRGPYPVDGSYDIGNHSPYIEGGQNGYAGGGLTTIGRIIFWNYYGEFWKDQQTNKWQAVYDNGLLLGIFGPSSDDSRGVIGYPGYAGGVHFGTAVKVGNAIYIYHAEEAGFSGVHRWKIDNLASIQEGTALSVQATTTRGFVAQPSPGIDLLADLPRNSVIYTGTAGITRSDNQEAGEQSVQTSVLTYDKRKSPDLFVSYGPYQGTFSVAKELAIPSGQTNYTLSFNLESTKFYPNVGSYGADKTGGVYVELLDDQQKIIGRYEQKINGSNLQLLFNGSQVASGNKDTASPLTNMAPITMSVSGSLITFKYGPYGAITVSKFDPTANLANLRYIRTFFWVTGTGGDQGRQVDYSNMFFKAN